MKHHKLFLQASNCAMRLTGRRIEEVLDALNPGSEVLSGPTVVETSSGPLGILITEHTVFIVHSDGETTLCLDILSSQPVNEQKYLTLMAGFSNIKNVKVFEVPASMFSPLECQEPRCTQHATKEYQGTFFCRDHYEQWMEKEGQQQWEADQR